MNSSRSRKTDKATNVRKTRNFAEGSIIDAIDQKRSLEQSLTAKELLALQIAVGAELPRGKHTIDWARTECRRILRDISEIAYLHKIAKRACESGGMTYLEDAWLLPFVVEKPKTKATLDVSGMLMMEGILDQADKVGRGLPKVPKREEGADDAG